MKETITLKGAGVGDQEFEANHAQSILDFQRKNPPTSWVLNDANYKMVSGKITKIEQQTPPPAAKN